MSATQRIADRFDAAFPAEVAWRRIGREAEHPVVHPDGAAADVAQLMPRLADGLAVSREGELIVMVEGPDFAFAAEVGRGTIEVITRPCDDLHELASVRDAAMERLLAAADAEGLAVLGYGVQPLTPPTPALMTPKARYGVLLEAIGEAWMWFTLTASDQVQVDLARPELWPTTNLGNLLAPVTVALCANSPVHSGAASGFCSAREGTMGTIGAAAHRHGMPGGPVADALDFVERLVPLPCWMVREGGQPRRHHGTFAEWLHHHADADEDAVWAAYLLHEHYVWHSARPRTAHATLEMRSACQQPGDGHDAAAALALGVVTAAPQIADFLARELGDEAWPAMRAWHHRVIAEGLAAPEPFDGLMTGVLDRCAEGLARRGRGEEGRLEPLWSRLERRRSPAHDALAAFEAGGVRALVAQTRLR